MHCIILIGQDDSFETYLNDFITTHSIQPFNTIRYTDPIKIQDIKKIIGAVKLKLGKNEKRLIVLNNTITLAAQNALLKTLEELPNDTYIFILTPQVDLLLPTVVSRCSVIQLHNTNGGSCNSKLIHNYSTLSTLIQHIALSVHTKEDYKQLLLDLRILLLTSQNRELLLLLKYLHNQYPLIEVNNVTISGIINIY